MAHEITIRADGFAEAAFAREPAWHGLGKVLPDLMTPTEALREAGLDWRVSQRRVAVEVPNPGGVEWQKIADAVANVREDNGEVLGLVSKHYKVVQNTEAFDFMESLVEGHEIRFESAFSLQGGRKVVLLAQMPGSQQVAAGDHLLPYVLMSSSHDGSEAIRFGPTAVRVVCANTYSLAAADKSIGSLSIRHSGDVHSKLKEARAILSVASDRFSQYAEVGQELAKRRLAVSEWEAFLEIMCPRLDPRDPDWTPAREKRIEETRESIRREWLSEKKIDGGTAWGAINAVTAHIDHLPRRGGTRQRKAEARFNVCLYGIGRDMKQRAMVAICRVAGVALAT